MIKLWERCTFFFDLYKNSPEVAPSLSSLFDSILRQHTLFRALEYCVCKVLSGGALERKHGGSGGY